MQHVVKVLWLLVTFWRHRKSSVSRVGDVESSSCCCCCCCKRSRSASHHQQHVERRQTPCSTDSSGGRRTAGQGDAATPRWRPGRRRTDGGRRAITGRSASTPAAPGHDGTGRRYSHLLLRRRRRSAGVACAPSNLWRGRTLTLVNNSDQW